MKAVVELEPAAPEVAAPAAVADPARVRALVDEHFRFVWRLLRRLGLSEADADDIAQQVFVVGSNKLDVMIAGSERGFLYRTAVHLASRFRRSRGRRREDPSEGLERLSSAEPDLDELVDRRRAREMLDSMLEHLPEDQRTVFVLFEIEQLTSVEIASVLELPIGTVASRLRRAREQFQAELARRTARERFRGRVLQGVRG
jgi:RNA polymerase sigma-70 factor (ECF subfamily)